MLRVSEEERLKEGGEREKDAPENAKHGSGAIISQHALSRIALYGRFARRISLQKVNFQTGSYHYCVINYQRRRAQQMGQQGSRWRRYLAS